MPKAMFHSLLLTELFSFRFLHKKPAYPDIALTARLGFMPAELFVVG